jgi:dolichyl-phosphate-mannose--protein O-mannosyl transferase
LTSRDLRHAGLLALMVAAFRLPRYGLPNEEIFDEVYHAKTALEYLNGQNPTEWVHPPTAKLLIAVGVHFLGYDAWAWRLAPVLAGILLAPVFFLLARRVLASERAALFASGLLLCDGVYLVQSRVAMTNIFAVLFQLLSALLVVRAVLRSASRSRRAGRASGPGASWASSSSLSAAGAASGHASCCCSAGRSSCCRSRSTC